MATTCAMLLNYADISQSGNGVSQTPAAQSVLPNNCLICGKEDCADTTGTSGFNSFHDLCKYSPIE
jgi:hypothetical protein